MAGHVVRLAAIVDRFEPALKQRYGERLLPDARQALRAIKRCKSDAAPHWLARCSQCPNAQALPHSCGHRACPHCQHGVGERWLTQQRERLLPVDYYLVTFTLPSQLRGIALDHQRTVYGAMLSSAWATLLQFARNDPKLGGDIGATAVLHTHNRRRDLHPHVHLVVPAGGFNGKTALWRSKRRYLFNERNLATVFIAGPHFSHLLRKIAQGFAPRTRREEKEWLFHCDDEQRSHRRKEPARAAKRADAGVHAGIAARQDLTARHKGIGASARAGVRNAG